MRASFRLFFQCCSLLSIASIASAQDGAVGAFEGHADVGIAPQKGRVEFTQGLGEYRITGGGANIWGAADAFQFAWKRLSGDVTITADVRFLGTGAVAHRKAVLMVRQSLDPDSPYADVALHGDGMTSLQYRAAQGGMTQEVRAADNAPVRIRLERRGNQFTMYVGKPGEELKQQGTATVALPDAVYAGLGVCSHDAEVLETAVFSNVTVEAQPKQKIRSRISIYDLRKKTTKVVYTADTLWEAPNWSPDGKYLLANSGGSLFRLNPDATETARPERVNLAASYRCNNDHGISPDGKMLAISASTPNVRGSQVFLVGADGADPKLMTEYRPSYFHGWSPDGKMLAFVGQRDGNFDLFRIPASGGPEQRLTSNKGYDDGPDYSPDGKWIYFNSDRSGSWDIWRIPADGGGTDDAKAERITSDEEEDWFPHPSPNGKWLLFLSFPKGTKGHNDRIPVQLRMMPLPGNTLKPGKIGTVTKFFGGQGTINVNSWSPDSTRFAFVSYEMLPVK